MKEEIRALTLNPYLTLGGLSIVTLILNLPFGFLRSRAAKYSLRWLLYIHLPVPFIYLLRRMLLSDLYIPLTISLLVAAAILGQVLGGKINTLKNGL